MTHKCTKCVMKCGVFLGRLLRSLVDAEAEFRDNAHKMVENVRLFALVICPGLILDEEIHIYRDAVGAGFLLCYNQVKGCVYVGMRTQIDLSIYPISP